MRGTYQHAFLSKFELESSSVFSPPFSIEGVDQDFHDHDTVMLDRSALLPKPSCRGTRERSRPAETVGQLDENSSEIVNGNFGSIAAIDWQK